LAVRFENAICCGRFSAWALDGAIVIALVAFVATVAYGTYIERGHPE
jgi:multisubunit Na+/H+ antiporter MnhF subunit